MNNDIKRLTLTAAVLLLAVGLVAGSEPPRTLELVQTISLKGKAGRLDHLALDAKGQRLFVANLSNDSLDIVNLKAGKLLKQISGQGKIQGVAYAPDLDRIFVGNGEDGVCNAFDGKDYSLLKSFKLPDADNVRYDAKSARIYVTHAENALTALDAKALKSQATIKLPGPPEAFQLNTADSRIFLNCTSPSEVVVIDTKKLEVAATYPLQGRRATILWPSMWRIIGSSSAADSRPSSLSSMPLQARKSAASAFLETPTTSSTMQGASGFMRLVERAF